MNKSLIIAGAAFLLFAVFLWFYNNTLSVFSGLIGLILLAGGLARKRKTDLLNLEDREAAVLP